MPAATASLLPCGTSVTAAVGGEDDRGVVRPAEDLTGGDVVDHEQVAALAGSLARAW